MKLVVTAAAYGDMENAVKSYDSVRTGLGLRFNDRMEECLRRIREKPQAYGTIAASGRLRTFRACRLAQFPYVAYFEIGHDRLVLHAVLHGRRNATRILRGRMEGPLP